MLKTKDTNPNHNFSTLVDWWDHLVQTGPDMPALEYGEKTISRRSLNNQAEQIAARLTAEGLTSGALVGIAVNRSLEMVAGLLGILKAGCAYVPMDVNYPEDRLKWMLEDADLSVVLTQTELIQKLPQSVNTAYWTLDNMPDPAGSFEPVQIVPSQPAYVIYTSGSTGRPKGVMIAHQSVVNLIAGQLDLCPEPTERFLFAYSFAFDGSVLLFFWALLSGGTLVMAPDNLEKDIHLTATFIKKAGITHLLTFPSLYTLLLDQGADLLTSLQHVSVAGESCPGALARRHSELLPGVRFFNQYGPTECTVGATIFEVPAGWQDPKVPIGKAIRNVYIRILNEQDRESKPLEPGEICIGGAGVALGYWKRQELTNQRFVQDPYGKPGDKVYRTGDLGQWLPDGNVDFLGRLDYQVKIRGYRIEPGEIEAVILEHPAAREAVVVALGESPDQQRLVAYLSSAEGKQLSEREIRLFLDSRLPAHLLPAQYVFLDQLPLAPSGKVDRKALPAPGKKRPNLDSEYEPAKTTLQQWLVEQWEQVTEVQPIGIRDKFFELGGNSLQAARFIAALQKRLEENIFVTTLFQHPDIAAFSAFLEKNYRVERLVADKQKPVVNTEKNKTLQESDFLNFSNWTYSFPIGIKQTENPAPPAVLILAPPRSGTTLLRVMLAGHPGLFAASELQLLHFDRLEEREQAYQNQFSIWREGLVRTVMELKQLEPAAAEHLIQTWVDAGWTVSQCIQQLQQWIGSKLLVDKSPSYALDPNALARAEQYFDQPFYIHLVRHPAAMTASFAKMHMDQAMFLRPGFAYSSAQVGELIWEQSHRNVLQFFENIPEARRITILYEDLVKAPETVMRRLCERFGWEYHPAMAKPYEGLEHKMTDGLYADSKPMGDINFLEHGSIRPEMADKWRDQEKSRSLHAKTIGLSNALGYQPEAASKQSFDLNAPMPIAITGMSACFPGAETVAEFWQNLLQEKDVSKLATAADLLEAGIDPALLETENYVRRYWTMDDVDAFDAGFFGYLPQEASLMDPQHRVLLQLAWHAMEDAGYNPEHLEERVGVFAAVARNTYLTNNVITHPNFYRSLDDFITGIAQEKDFPATKIAYKLGLRGPAVNVQTACSSSGVAIHLACQSLRSGDSDVVLVGAGRLQPPVKSGYNHTDGHALSPDGYCRAFDADAGGMARGQGMSCIVLKPLNKALEAGDQIYAIIRGSAINNDADRKIGYTAPSSEGQAEAIQRAYATSGVDPENIDYIETHGTGTRIGDPIEYEGLRTVFQSNAADKTVWIGSVKTNIGHLDAGACLAGVIKTALALKYKKLPANLHFSSPHPGIPWESSPLRVNDQLRDWPEKGGPRRAAVNSLGLGGTNAHIILEEPPIQDTPKEDASFVLLPFSAKSQESLAAQLSQWPPFLADHPELDIAAAAFTLQNGRKAFKYRKAVIASSGQNLSEILENPASLWQVADTAQMSGSEIAFLFPGGGAQHVNMGRGLYEAYPVFRHHIEDCFQRLQDGPTLTDLYPADPDCNDAIEDPLDAIVTLFIVEFATAKLLQSWGLKPAVLIGHSLGEYTAACLAGVFSLDDGLKMVAGRGRLFRTLAPGGMLSVPLSPEALAPYLDETYSIAAINKPDQCVVSGTDAAIDALSMRLEAAGITSNRLRIAVAAHSHLIEPILAPFAEIVKTIKYKEASIPMVSNLSGQLADPEIFASPEYWLQHLRRTVRYADGIQVILEKDIPYLIEVGPGQTLSTLARQHPGRKHTHTILSALRHPKEKAADTAFILKMIAQLWVKGFPIDWSAWPLKKQRISLPGYAFEKQRHWISPKQTALQGAIMNTQNLAPMNGASNHKKDLAAGKIRELLQEMSGLSQQEMSDHATFLEMGFDSLFLTQFTAQLKKRYQLDISFRQLFETTPNIAALSGLLAEVLPDPGPAAVQPIVQTANNGNVVVPIHTAAPTPAYFPPPAQTSVPGSGLEAILQQQLLIMQQQLALLAGTPVATLPQVPQQLASANGNGQPAPVQIVPEPAKKKVTESETPVVDEKAGKAHGPWKPIEKKQQDGLEARQQQYLKKLIADYTQKTAGSQALTQAQRRNLADPRSISGFQRLWSDMIYQIAVVKSKGARVWDVDGHEYVDYRMSFGISLFGHTPDFIQQALHRQIEDGIELGVLTPLAKEVADLLCVLSGVERVTLVNTGSEALAAAVRAARTATGRDKVVVFEGDYHGISDELLARNVKRGGKNVTVPVAPGIPMNAVQNVMSLDYDDPRLFEMLEAHAAELAAIIIEPLQPAYPHIQRGDLFRKIRSFATKHDIALVFDEMITGFRLAPRGAQEWFGVEADLIAYGKIISGGLPMAALAGKAKYLDVFDGGYWEFGNGSVPEVGVTFFGGTFVRHPMSLVSAKAALTAIQEGGIKLYRDLNEKTYRFAERLRDLFQQTKAPLRIYSAGSIITIKPVEGNLLYQLFFYYARLHGVHLTDKAMLLSTAHTQEDLNKTYRAFEESIREMQTAGFFPLQVEDIPDEHVLVPPPDLLDPQEEQILPLTTGQEEVWVEQQFGEGAAAAYNLSGSFFFKGSLQISLLQQALQIIVNRHEALRSYYDRNNPQQRLLPEWKVNLAVEDWTLEPLSEREQHWQRFVRQETAQPIDIFEPPLWRANLIRWDVDANRLVVTLHHGIADGWSWGIFITELSEIYSSLVKGKTASLPKPISLKHFVLQEKAFLNSKDYEKIRTYWKQELAGSLPGFELPLDRPRPKVRDYQAAAHQLILPAEKVKLLQKLAGKHGATPFALLYAAWQTLLARISGQQDWIIGLVAAGQAHYDEGPLLAHAAHILPVRTDYDPDRTFADHLKSVKSKLYSALEHQRFSLGALQHEQKRAGEGPVVSLMFNMDQAGAPPVFSGLEETQFQALPRAFETFDMFLNVKPESGAYIVDWIYNTGLWDAATIQNRLSEWAHLLDQLLEGNVGIPVQQLQIIPPSEWNLLNDWNDTVSDYPMDICVHKWFEQQVEKTPDRIAVTSQDQSWTYLELNKKANQIARNLRAAGVQPGDLVGVFFTRSNALLAALLGVMKAGAAYVPLDPANPADRLGVMLQDADATCIVVEDGIRNQLPPTAAKILKYSDILTGSGENQEINLSAKQYAYINYTSGSTGKPKGVLIPHHAVIDHHLAIVKALPFGEADTILSVASVAFDPSVMDFFMPLMFGAQVVIATEAEKADPFLLADLIEKYQPSLMQATPATWRMLLAIGWNGASQLQALSGGEGLTFDLGQALLRRTKSTYNIYGPTETTIWSTLYQVRPAHENATVGYEPVGQPLANVQIYLLDETMQQVPIGAPGEIYVGGVGVAPEGYHKRPELNREKFVSNPFDQGKTKLYRTGDLGRRRNDGNLEFLQRADRQVKVRGFRIELGEIESLLQSHTQVKDCVVISRPDVQGYNQLIAYFIPVDNKRQLELPLKNFLEDKLPAYMVPAFFVALDAFPMTATQKVDRNKLPDPIPAEVQFIEKPVHEPAAAGAHEAWLLPIWQELLKVQDIRPERSFFDLGGHSLLAVRLVQRIEQQTGFRLPLADILRYPTIRSLSRRLEEVLLTGEVHSASLVPIRTEGDATPLFLVPGAGLHVLMYQTFADHLDKGFPIYALQAKGLDGKEEPLETVEGMAAFFIDQMKQIVPHGPYRLAGYSFGGLIVFEMAKQLREMGEPAEFVGLIDAVVRPEITGEDPKAWKQLQRKGKKLLWTAGFALREPGAALQYKQKTLMIRNRRYEEKDSLTAQMEKKIHTKNALAFQHYRIRPYSGDLHLFRAGDKRFFLEDFEYLGWQPYVKGQLNVHEVPGDHLQLFDPPHGEALAHIFQKALDSAVLASNASREVV